MFPKLGQVEISLVCSNTNVKHGKILMDLVYQKAKELNYKYLFLLSLSELKLINWYKRLGFYILSEKVHSRGEIKAYAMIKDII
jgi:ribosomal protein S18 acetylase RimI-like enzyme